MSFVLEISLGKISGLKVGGIADLGAGVAAGDGLGRIGAGLSGVEAF